MTNADTPGKTTKQPLALRVRPKTLDHLRTRAADRGLPVSTLAERLIEEGLRTDEHPLVYFREGAAGRRPALVGTRLDVWQVIETVKVEASAEDAATYLGIGVHKVRACIAYYGGFRDEIDAWAEAEKDFAVREEAAWRRAHEAFAS